MADVLRGFSLASDLAVGLHAEHGARSCYIGMHLAEPLSASPTGTLKRPAMTGTNEHAPIFNYKGTFGSFSMQIYPDRIETSQRGVFWTRRKRKIIFLDSIVSIGAGSFLSVIRLRTRDGRHHTIALGLVRDIALDVIAELLVSRRSAVDPPVLGVDTALEIGRLFWLKEHGVITDAEFESQRTKLLK